MPAATSLPLIAVDIGNSAVKAARYATFDPESVPPIVRLATAVPDFNPLLALVDDRPCPWWVASVHRGGAERFAEWLVAARPIDPHYFVTYDDLPLVIDVRFPERVGVDRLLSATAANHLRDANRPAVIVDAGSAITVDAVDVNGTFLGGAILPGAKLMARALSVHTDQLPLVSELARAPVPIGKTTDEAIAAGVFWSVIGAIRELVHQVSARWDQPPQCFLTGGDAAWLASHLGDEFRHVPDLVLRGLVEAARHVAKASNQVPAVRSQPVGFGASPEP